VKLFSDAITADPTCIQAYMCRAEAYQHLTDVTHFACWKIAVEFCLRVHMIFASNYLESCYRILLDHIEMEK